MFIVEFIIIDFRRQIVFPKFYFQIFFPRLLFQNFSFTTSTQYVKENHEFCLDFVSRQYKKKIRKLKNKFLLIDTSRPRKGSEVDGQDYHFISRSQFESDILCRRFVEHGEYEKAYYGTSVEAIRTVVNSGKICVLNLHPQSLKILRSSDLKPYVVFVAPPSLEKLRQKRLKNNESFKEEELKDIIEKAREMEDKYGHLFDMIILNNDTDRAYNQLLTEINSLEREPQWVPASWVQ